MNNSTPPHVHCSAHPVLRHALTQLRDESATPERFRSRLRSIASILLMEATADLVLDAQPLRTPLESTTGEALARPLVFVPILRAGLGMLDAALDLVPDAAVGHLGVFRDEETLEPVEYYAKFPPRLSESTVLLLDPMLATGGSAMAAVQRLRAHGALDIRLAVLIAAPEGIAAFTSACPDVPVFTGAVDRQLNERGYILPGLGDAGDRLFATL